MIQPGNSNGISALSGSSDTFYGKNKSKTVESKLRRLTVICLVVMILLMIAFYLIQILLNVRFIGIIIVIKSGLKLFKPLLK